MDMVELDRWLGKLELLSSSLKEASRIHYEKYEKWKQQDSEMAAYHKGHAEAYEGCWCTVERLIGELAGEERSVAFVPDWVKTINAKKARKDDYVVLKPSDGSGGWFEGFVKEDSKGKYILSNGEKKYLIDFRIDQVIHPGDPEYPNPQTEETLTQLEKEIEAHRIPAAKLHYDSWLLGYYEGKKDGIFLRSGRKFPSDGG